MTDRDKLVVEGLAAQLYVETRSPFAWWHVLAEDVKEAYREQARKKIAKFKRDYPFPE